MTQNWKWVWKFKCNERIKFFVWLCQHNSIATNALRYDRQISNSNLCQRCNSHPETVLHTLRDCVDAKAIWKFIISPTQFLKFRQLSHESWIRENITKVFFDNIVSPDTPWPLMFAAVLWNIWKARNKFVFQNVNTSTHEVVQASKRLAVDMENVFSVKGSAKNKNQASVKWRCPTNGWFKINTDGSFIASESRATAGGLIRNENGEWVTGFARNLGNVSITMAELLAAREGLTMAWERRLPKIILEVDSEVVVKLICDAKVELHPLGNIIEDCRKLLSMPWESRIIHTLRSGNACADALATKGHYAPDGYQVWNDPPQDLLPLLEDDLT